MARKRRFELKINLVSGALPDALGLVADLRQGLLAGAGLAALLAILDDLGETLLDVESTVGVETPQNLFN